MCIHLGTLIASNEMCSSQFSARAAPSFAIKLKNKKVWILNKSGWTYELNKKVNELLHLDVSEFSFVVSIRFFPKKKRYINWNKS